MMQSLLTATRMAMTEKKKKMEATGVTDNKETGTLVHCC